MRAVVFENWLTEPVLRDVPKPTPGPGEVLLKVAGAGACHSDIAIYEHFTPETAPPALAPSYVLGHENSGWVEEVGEGVSGLEIGSAHLVYGPIGCGRCRACSRGQDTYCENAGAMPYLATGLGRDGGMAEYVVAPARNLVPLGEADPIAAAPLSDAALTPYHAIKTALPALAGAGKYALVVGLGGLGMFGVQILEALTGATVIATDMKPEAMALAEKYGAITVPGGPDQAAQIREITKGRGVDAAFDFVGVAPTIKLAMSVAALQSSVTVVGIAGGVFEWSFFQVPYETTLRSTYWGSIEDLFEVVDLYKAGKIEQEISYYALDEAVDAYRALAAGNISGRAVVAPHGLG